MRKEFQYKLFEVIFKKKKYNRTVENHDVTHVVVGTSNYLGLPFMTCRGKKAIFNFD